MGTPIKGVAESLLSLQLIRFRPGRPYLARHRSAVDDFRPAAALYTFVDHTSQVLLTNPHELNFADKSSATKWQLKLNATQNT